MERGQPQFGASLSRMWGLEHGFLFDQPDRNYRDVYIGSGSGSDNDNAVVDGVHAFVKELHDRKKRLLSKL